ncbi:MAG: hypothetical protein M3P48_09005, partial [Actinomycetota bacterium]|nr:hypothetical protein [Actinomycetota bacterium]
VGTEPLRPALPAAPAAVQRAEPAGEADTGWRPTPVPLPTYVTKPKAARSPRTIDLSQPGPWSRPGGEQRADEHREEAAPAAGVRTEPVASAPSPVAAAAPAPAEAGEEFVERRRAVGD